MLTSSYHVDSVEETSHLVLELELSFKRVFISKTREQYSKCEGYEHYDYQCPSKNRYVNIMPSDDVDDSRVVENVYISSKITSALRIY